MLTQENIEHTPTKSVNPGQVHMDWHTITDLHYFNSLDTLFVILCGFVSIVIKIWQNCYCFLHKNLEISPHRGVIQGPISPVTHD